jgi:hypothetical protein
LLFLLSRVAAADGSYFYCHLREVPCLLFLLFAALHDLTKAGAVPTI